ncbi:MAG: V4R domain-containing protein [Nitrososphaerales archaeon]
MTALNRKEGEPQLISRDGKDLLRDSITNSRVVVMGCSGYRSLCDALYEQFQSGSSVILYRMGEGYARNLLSAVPKLGMNTEQVIHGFERLAFLAGWGKINLRIIDDSTVECVVEKCAFVLRRQDVGSTSCYFFSGVLGAVTSALFDKKFTAKEVKCETSGTPPCKFMARVNSK